MAPRKIAGVVGAVDPRRIALGARCRRYRMHLARPVHTLVAGLALAACAATASAQSVRGVLLDAVTTRPIAGARITLLDSLGGEAAAVSTDSVGRFLLASPAIGQFRMRIRRIGYEPATSGAIS